MTVEPAVDGVLLAAGASSRFGSAVPKQLAELGGAPLVFRAADTMLRSSLRAVTVVTGYRDEDVRRALQGVDVAFVHNPVWRKGQSTSVAAGLRAVTRTADAVCFAPCDQPLLDSATLDRLVESFDSEYRPIVVPTFSGRRGAPVLFARRFFDELLMIEGDRGGRQLLSEHSDLVHEVELADERPLLDVDTLADLEQIRGSL